MRVTLWLALTFTLAISAAHVARAEDFVVIPNNYILTEGPAGSNPAMSGPRILQYLVNSNQLTGFVGRHINGFTYRLHRISPAWPASDVTFTDYRVYMSGSVAPSSRSNTFLNNVGGPRIQVRSGPLTIPGGAFPAGSPTGTYGPFGPDIAFDTPYLYSGGHLLVEMRFNSSGGLGPSFGAALFQRPEFGYGVDYASTYALSLSDSVGMISNFTVIRLHAVPLPTVPVTGTIALSDFGGELQAHAVQMTLTAVGSNVPIYAASVALSATGSYIVNVPASVPVGTYDLFADGSPFLRRKQTMSLTSTGAVNLNFVLPNGDCDNSGEVDAADIDAVIAAFGLTVGSSGYSLTVDVDGSGEVDAADIDIVIASFGSVND